MGTRVPISVITRKGPEWLSVGLGWILLPWGLRTICVFVVVVVVVVVVVFL